MKEHEGHHHNHGHDGGDHHGGLDPEKLGTLIPYLKKHNLDHIEDLKKWQEQAARSGFSDVAAELGRIVELSERIDRHFAAALDAAGGAR